MYVCVWVCIYIIMLERERERERERVHTYIYLPKEESFSSCEYTDFEKFCTSFKFFSKLTFCWVTTERERERERKKEKERERKRERERIIINREIINKFYRDS